MSADNERHTGALTVVLNDTFLEVKTTRSGATGLQEG